jgi:hypothetical protein
MPVPTRRQGSRHAIQEDSVFAVNRTRIVLRFQEPKSAPLGASRDPDRAPARSIAGAGASRRSLSRGAQPALRAAPLFVAVVCGGSTGRRGSVVERRRSGGGCGSGPAFATNALLARRRFLNPTGDAPALPAARSSGRSSMRGCARSGGVETAGSSFEGVARPTTRHRRCGAGRAGCSGVVQLGAE